MTARNVRTRVDILYDSFLYFVICISFAVRNPRRPVCLELQDQALF